MTDVQVLISSPCECLNRVSEYGARYNINIRNLNKAWVHLILPWFFFKDLDGFKFSKNKNTYSDINLPICLFCVVITTTAYYQHNNNLYIYVFNIINLY